MEDLEIIEYLKSIEVYVFFDNHCPYFTARERQMSIINIKYIEWI